MKNKAHKLRNIFLTAVFFSLSTFSYGQTKEETISWLKEKLNSNMWIITDEVYSNLKLESINECSFTITYSSFYCQYHKCGLCAECTSEKQYYTAHITYLIDGNLLFNQENEQIVSKIKNVKIVKNFINGKVETRQTDGNDYRDGNLKIENKETEILNRILKALDHLAIFCPKKKETF